MDPRAATCSKGSPGGSSMPFPFLHANKGGYVHLHPRKKIKPKEVLVFLFVGFLSLLILFPSIGLDVFVCYWYGGSMAVPYFLLSVSS